MTLFTDGSFSYTPDAGFHGVDSFTYSVSDGAFSSTAVATINVGTTGNNPPVTVDDSYSTLHDHQLVESAAAGVLANDSDPDGDTLTAILNGDGTTTHGHVSLASNGSFTRRTRATTVSIRSATSQAMARPRQLGGVDRRHRQCAGDHER